MNDDREKETVDDDRELLFLSQLHPDKTLDDVRAKLETARNGEGVEDPLVRAGELLSKKDNIDTVVKTSLKVELEDYIIRKGFREKAARLALWKTGFNTSEALRWLERVGKVSSLEDIVYDNDEDSEVPPPPPPDWSGGSDCDGVFSPEQTETTHQQWSSKKNPFISQELSPGNTVTESQMRYILMQELWQAISKLTLPALHAEISRLKKLSQGDAISQVPTQRHVQTSISVNNPYQSRRRRDFREQTQPGDEWVTQYYPKRRFAPPSGANGHPWEESKNYYYNKHNQEDRRNIRRQKRVVAGDGGSFSGAGSHPCEEKNNHLQIKEERRVRPQRIITDDGESSGSCHFWQEERKNIRPFKEDKGGVCPQERVITSRGGLPFGYPRHPKMNSYLRSVAR